MTIIRQPECAGTGIYTHCDGYYFDDRFGNYLPKDRDERCSDCKGSGQVLDGYKSNSELEAFVQREMMIQEMQTA